MARDVKFNIKLSVDGKEQIVTASTNVTALARELGVAQQAANNFKKGVDSWGQFAMGVNALQSSVSQLSGFLNSALGESLGFNAAMREANTMAGKGAEDFARLKSEVADLAKTVPVARDALAKGLYQVISNGVPEDNWLSYLEASARSSVGGLANLEEVVKVTSTVIKNYGMEWSAAQEIQDKIQLTAKNGVTSFEQLAGALPSVTGQAAQLGVSLDEMLGVMSTLTGVTGNTNEVATQLASVLTALTKESSKSQKMAEQMGISFNAASIKAAGGLRNWLMELDRTVTAYADKSGQLKESIYSKLFGRAEALRLVNALTGEMTEKFGENIGALKDSLGTMDGAFNEVASTGSAKLQILKNKFGELTDAVAGVAGGFLPVLNFTAQLGMTATSVMTLKKAFSSLSVAQALSNKQWKMTLAAHLAFPMNARKAAAAMTVMANATRSAATAAVAAKVALRGLMVATGVGAALAALGFVVEKLVGHFDKAGDEAKELADAENEIKRAQADAIGMLSAHKSRLEALIVAKKEGKDVAGEEKAMLKELNDAYGETMGYYQDVSDWYKTLIKNSDDYCKMMVNEAETRQLANKIAELRQQRDQIFYSYPDPAMASRAVAGMDAELDKMEKRMGMLAKERLSLTGKMKGGGTAAGGGASTAGGKGTPKPSPKPDKELRYNPNAQTKGEIEDNVKWLDKEIDKANKLGGADKERLATLVKQREAAKGQLEVLAEQERELAAPRPGQLGEAGGYLEKLKEEGVTTYRELDAAIAEHEARLQDADAAGRQAITAEIERLKAQREAWERVAMGGTALERDRQWRRDEYNKAQGKAQTLKQDYEIGLIGKDALLEALREINAELEKLGLKPIAIDIDTGEVDKSREKMKAATDAVGQMGQSVGQLGSALELPELNVAGTIAQAIATMVQGYATATEGAAKMGPIAWAAFAATGLGQLAAIIASVKNVSKYADGGIAYGPTLGLFGEYAGASHNPEVVAPLDKLRGMLGGGAVVVGGRIEVSGRKLAVLLEHEKGIAGKSGRRL